MQIHDHLSGVVGAELRSFAFQVLGAAPGSGNFAGRFYWDSALLAPRWYDGAAWTNKASDSLALGGQSSGFHLGRVNHTGTQLALTISDFDTQVRTSRLDQMAGPSASVSLNNQRITNLATPTAVGDAATKAYVDAARAGLDVKDSVRAASSAAITLTYTATGGVSARGQITAAPDVVDGVALVVDDRLLVKDQVSGAQNGIYMVSTVGSGSNGVWDRASDYDADAEVTSGSFAFVEEGTTNDNTGWVLTTNNPIVIGGPSGTALAFTQFSSAGVILAGAGLTKTGNTLDVVAGAAPAAGGPGGGLVVAADSVAIDTGVVNRKGALTLVSSATVYTVAHGLGIADVVVTVRNVSSGEVEYPRVVVDATNITITFLVAPSVSAFRVVWSG